MEPKEVTSDPGITDWTLSTPGAYRHPLHRYAPVTQVHTQGAITLPNSCVPLSGLLVAMAILRVPAHIHPPIQPVNIV